MYLDRLVLVGGRGAGVRSSCTFGSLDLVWLPMAELGDAFLCNKVKYTFMIHQHNSKDLRELMVTVFFSVLVEPVYYTTPIF